MTDSRRLVLTIVNTIVLVSACLAGVWKMTEPAPRVVAATGTAVADAPLLSTTTETTTTVAPATTAAPAPAASKPKPKPAAPPRPRAPQEPIQEIGTIEIPKIGLTHAIFHGISMRNIDKGPSHWPGTAFPGEVGNSVFAGHRVTHSHPFRHIDRLAPNDEVFFTVNGVRTRYLVTGHEIVPPTALWIVDATQTPTATLFACHPPGSARQRYVVRLALATD